MSKTSQKITDPSGYILPININGLNGRMLSLPSQKTSKNREILIVYGLHASIERMFGFVEDLNQYGPVTIADLPGFGGMDNFYKIGLAPTLDNMADYLATFIKMKFKRKRFTLIGMSYGFLVATRMLQKYPDIAKKIDLVISLVGFSHHEDFRMSNKDMNLLKAVCWIGSYKVPSILISSLVFRDLPIRTTYKIVAKNHRKMKDADKEELNRRIDFEVNLWKINHARTKAKVCSEMFKIDLCNKQVQKDVYHVAIADDHFFDNNVVEQHMSVIYDNVVIIYAEMKGHAPTVIADVDAARPFIPQKLRRLLSQKTK
jgi:pimeloyl-ACP methyl ester carboxylesterase